MRAYIVRRLLLTVPTLFIVSFVIFVVIRFMPGDIVDAEISQMQEIGVSQESLEQARGELMKKYGLDIPIIAQYGRWIGVYPQADGAVSGLLQGDFGTSFRRHTPVLRDIAIRWPVTLELGLIAFVIANLISLPIGVYSALRQDTVSDYVVRRLPIGVQTLRTFREQDCYYVDKTPYLERLLNEGTRYFLSRPRRFGKSLFLDTLKEFFEGNEALFAGLHIHERHDWSERHPVVRLSFGGGTFKDLAPLNDDVMAQLDGLARDHGVPARYDTAPARFRHLLQAVHEGTGQRVAMLVDEYDKPILDALEVPESALANRDYLRGLYGVIKDSDAHVQFTFLTGISKFSKVNLFSQLNNLVDITLDPVYSSICGYTEDDLDSVFAPELATLNHESVREWYNGYNWRGADKVYNPYDVLLLLRRGEYAAHWFETGTPAFLVKKLFERRVASVSLDQTVTTEALLSAFDVDHIGTEALLFQTGYLTITGEERLGGRALYRLGFPNREVRQSLNEHLLRHLVQDVERQTANSIRLQRLLAEHDCAALKELFQAFFTNNDIANYEGYYASVFYSYFAALGYDITVEESSSHGRLDMAVRAGGHVYLFEFKVAEMAPPGSALTQLQVRDYAAKYRSRGEPIHLIGVEFSRHTRNITAFDIAAD